MLRVLLAIGLAMWVALTAGAVTSFASAPCAAHCDDDDEQGNCAPDCVDCACCPHLRLSFTVVELKFTTPAADEPVPETSVSEPPSPEPGDVLHVPKAQRV